jgi:uroporphyrinogen decarboxylase
VWLMRQAGRYMAAFRKYSDRIPFRERSETSSIAIELSLQPWYAFKPDGVIMFSDILTPLPALGIDFDVIKGKGPVIADPVADMDRVRALRPMDDPAAKLPFVAETLRALRAEVDGKSTLLGFIGTPWTLAAYSVEGKADRNCRKTKIMMLRSPAVLHALLAHLADALADYAIYQIDAGAQVVQLFDSWAHHLSPEQFAEFSLPYAERVMAKVRAVRPGVPLIFHANGGTGKHEIMATSTADVLGLDWATTMAAARHDFGAKRTLQGNVDPMVLFGSEKDIETAVERCLLEAGSQRHILNVGHGVIEGTPEDSVGVFCELARRSAEIHARSRSREPVAA